MKSALTIVTLLWALFAQGQGFPVNVTNTSLPITGNVGVSYSGRPTTRNEIFQQESDPLDLSYTSVSSGTGVIGRSTSFTPFNIGLIDYVQYGFQARVNSFVITSNGPCRVTGYVRKFGSAASLPKATSNINVTFGANGGVVTIPTPDLTLYGGAKIILTKTETSTAVSPDVDFYTSGNMISENAHYDAKYIHWSLGNSITWTSLGLNSFGQPNTGKTHFISRIIATMRKEGIDIRESKRGFGGSVVQNWVLAIDQGAFENQQYDKASLVFGTNEAAINDATAVDAVTGMNFQQSIEYIVDYLLEKNPNGSIDLYGPPPATTSPRATNLASYRTAYLAVKNNPKYAGKDLTYYDLSAAIPVPSGANDSNFTETAANQQVHPRGDTGHLKMYQGAMPIIRSGQFYINNKNLSKPLAP